MTVFKNYLKELLASFKRNDLTLLAAAQAYYYLLSVVPLLFVCFALIPYFKIEPNDAMNFIGNILPGEIASLFKDNIIEIVQEPKGGLLTIGIIGALWSASNGINAFISAANRAYEVEETRNFLKVRLTALVLTIGIVLAFITAIFLPIIDTLITSFLTENLGSNMVLSTVISIVRWSLMITILTLILYALYRFAPNKRLTFRYLLPGAITASILWQIISALFSFYVGNFGNYSATYGSLGGIIILVIWFFLTGLILMIGIEINAIYHQRKNR